MKQLELLDDAPVWRVVPHPDWPEAVAVQNRLTGQYHGRPSATPYIPSVAVMAAWKAKRLNKEITR